MSAPSFADFIASAEMAKFYGATDPQATNPLTQEERQRLSALLLPAAEYTRADRAELRRLVRKYWRTEVSNGHHGHRASSGQD